MPGRLQSQATRTSPGPGLWASVLNTKQLPQPRWTEGSQVLTAGGRGLGPGVPPCSMCTSLGSPHALSPGSLHACCPTGELAFAAANTGGGVLPATHCHARMANHAEMGTHSGCWLYSSHLAEPPRLLSVGQALVQPLSAHSLLSCPRERKAQLRLAHGLLASTLPG